MKYTAIATIVLLLLPLIPIAIANQPPPQLWNVEFRVKPGMTKFYGPCVVSTMFPIDVYLWNDRSLTNTSVYAYDFFLYWKNDVGISVDSWTVHIPWPSGKFFVVKNETGTYLPDTTFDFYHLAVTAVGNSTTDTSLLLGYSALFNASLVTLNFHIDEEPCWPGFEHTLFTIGNELGAEQVLVPWPPLQQFLPHVTECTGTITNIEIDNGEYWLLSSQPNIDPLVAANDPGRVNDHIFKEKSIGETHTITIALSNITGAYGFEFCLHWDPLWYNASIQHVTILPAFAPPYESLDMTMGQGSLYVKLLRPCEKPGIHAAGYTPVVSVDFVTTNTPEVGVIPYAANTTFSLTCSVLYAKCPELTEYFQGTDNGTRTLWYSGDIIQMFVPKSKADLNIDGVVDVADLSAIAKKYGASHPWSGLVDPSGKVDIFDIVYVAKRQGDP